jgi:hypothetical protein
MISSHTNNNNVNKWHVDWQSKLKKGIGNFQVNQYIYIYNYKSEQREPHENIQVDV